MTAHAYVQYRCGHEKWIALPRKKAERKQKQEWIATQLCADCYRHFQRAERARQAYRDREDARQYGLVELRGSATMVTWALRIRAECVAEIDRRFEQRRNQPGVVEEVLQQGRSACIRAINRQTDASWWVDHLEDLPHILTQDYLQELIYDPTWRGFPEKYV